MILEKMKTQWRERKGGEKRKKYMKDAPAKHGYDRRKATHREVLHEKVVLCPVGQDGAISTVCDELMGELGGKGKEA
jgi:hypothetical protein